MRAARIELALPAWKAGVIPVDHARIRSIVPKKTPVYNVAMPTKQIIVALGLLVAGIAVFGFISTRTEPIAQPPQILTASEYVEGGEYLFVRVEYPEAPAPVRAVIEQEMGQEVATFKANANIEALTPEDIEFMGLGEGRKYALEAEVTTYTAPGYTSYAYAVYEDTLGAHPNGHFKTFVFNQANKQVSLGDLLGTNPNWLEELSLVVSNDIVAQVKARLASTMPAGDEGPDVVSLLYPEGLAPTEDNFKNFVIDGADLLVLIPPYQVAAYAMGSFEVRVPLASLQ